MVRGHNSHDDDGVRLLRTEDLTQHGAPSELVDVWSARFGDLTDIQARAVRANVLDGRTNLLAVAPTSSGKTFVGEMAATTSAFVSGGHAVFLVPYKAVAEEHYERFRERYHGLLNVVISTADWPTFDDDVRRGSYNLAVMTYEKLLAFLVGQPGLLSVLSTVVIDEIQMIGDTTRGSQLELLLTRILLLDNGPQLVGLSASLDELNDLDGWLRASLVQSNQRPVELVQGVCSPSGVAVVGNAEAQRTEALIESQDEKEAVLHSLATSLVAAGDQVLIFRTTVGRTRSTATALATKLAATGVTGDLAAGLAALDDSDVVPTLRHTLASGVAFHNADLTYAERRLVEDAFRDGAVRALVSTTTLAMGVNLPTDVVLVADHERPELVRNQWQWPAISVAEYRNAAGRAGRLGLRTAGRAYLLANDDVERAQLFRAYITGQVEPVESQIPKQPLDDVVFRVVAADLADSRDGLVEFITHTFAYRTWYDRHGGIESVRTAVDDAVERALASGLIAADDERLAPTQVARVLAAAGVGLATATRFVTLLDTVAAGSTTRQDLAVSIAGLAEFGAYPFPPRHDPRPGLALTAEAGSERLEELLAKRDLTDAEASTLYRAACLLDWMQATAYRTIRERYGELALSRVQGLGNNSAWLLETLHRAGVVRGLKPEALRPVRDAAVEARYGLPAALAPIARLRVTGVSRDDLRRVFEAGQPELYDRDAVLDLEPPAFDGLLTAAQVTRLQAAILEDTEESTQRRHTGHRLRAARGTLDIALIDSLYEVSGSALDRVVAEALRAVGISATPILRQPHGEEDVHVAHPEGTIIVSVTASVQPGKPVSWNKAKEILGAGAGKNPINYVCVGRPRFDGLAERSASDISREVGPRTLLLIPMHVLAEAIVRCSEGRMTGDELLAVLRSGRGHLEGAALPDVRAPAALLEVTFDSAQ